MEKIMEIRLRDESVNLQRTYFHLTQRELKAAI